MSLGIVASSHVVTSAGISVIASTTTTYSATVSFAVTFGTSPVENDVIVLFCGSITGGFTWNGGVAPTGWTLALPTGVVHVGAALSFGAIYHIVTAGEDAANTVTWTLTSALSGSSETGGVVAVNLRGVNTSTPIDAYGTSAQTTAVTSHNLAAVTGTDITNSGGLVLRAVGSDGVGAYSAIPAGHTLIAATTTTEAVWVGQMDNAATAGVNIATAAITPTGTEEAGAITLVLTPA